MRRQLHHDLSHQLGSIMMLAAAVEHAPDVGPESRARVAQVLGEAHRMDQLLRAYRGQEQGELAPAVEPLRVDRVAAELVETLRLTRVVDVSLVADGVWAYVDDLALWRALRNVLDNASRAAAWRSAAEGTVEVRVFQLSGWAVLQVDDDGPGFGAGPAGLAAVGLGIVRDFAVDHGGRLEIGQSPMGGCRVRILVPGLLDQRGCGESHASAGL